MATNRLEEQIECPVCFERFQTPKLLPCQHTFCLQCLERIAEGGHTVLCPECRSRHSVPTNGVSGFPTNITTQRLIEAMNPPNVPSSSYSRSNDRTANRPTHSVGNTFERQTSGTSRNTARRPNSNRILDRTSNVVISPSAPPFNYPIPTNRNQTQSSEDVEVQLAIDISREEQRRRIQNNGETDGDMQAFLKKIRKTLRHLAGRILNDHKTLLSAFIYVFVVVTFSRFVAGAAKLSADCPLERRAAIYQFVKACFASLFWGVLVVWSFKKSLKKALDNAFVEAYIVIESLFSICWLFVGTAWIMGNFYTIHNQCPEYVPNWNEHFINFALFLTVVDYIGLVVFLFYTGYTICDEEDDND